MRKPFDRLPNPKAAQQPHVFGWCEKWSMIDFIFYHEGCEGFLRVLGDLRGSIKMNLSEICLVGRLWMQYIRSTPAV